MSLKESMDALRSKAAQLNKLTDEAAASVKLVEEFLCKECSIGVEVWIETHYEKYTMGYSRYGGSGFRIMVRNDTLEKAWTEWDRTVKLETIPALPKLVQAVADEAGRILKHHEQSVLTTKEILESIFNKG